MSETRAQELNCKFQINHEQVQGTNVQVFETLQTAITEFLNERRWTQAQYAPNERIRCSMNLTIKTYDENEGRFEGELTVQSTRPVFNSTYQTNVFLFRDGDVGFNYVEFDPLELRDFTEGLLCGISSADLMPCAFKCLVTLAPSENYEELRQHLMLTPRELRRWQKMNMLIVDNNG